MVLEQHLNGGNRNVGEVQENDQQRKQGATDSIGLYVAKCCKCKKWRIIPTKEQYETIRENLIKKPWFCSRNTGRSCEQPEDIQYDSSRIWVMDKPGILKPPPETERLVIMRSDMSRMDTYYVMPNGKRASRRSDIEKFLEVNPEYKATMAASRFSFATPKIDKETVSERSMWVAAMFVELGMEDSSTSSSNNNTCSSSN